jgi:hypothetical protein
MKRFTDTAKWSDPWFRRLSAPAKMLWFYILDHCDHVGMIELDLVLASQDCGIPIDETTLGEIGCRIERAGKDKFIVPKFIKFQIGEPSESCKAHTKIIQAIDELGLWRDSEGYHFPNDRLLIDYPKTINSHIDKEEEKEKEEEEEEAKGKARKSKARPELISEVVEFAKELGRPESDGEYLWHHWQSNGYTNSGRPIKDWKATARKWAIGGYLPSQKNPSADQPTAPKPKRPLPANWREIAGEIYGQPIEDESTLTDYQRAEIIRESR